jgi:hypothetical protein
MDFAGSESTLKVSGGRYDSGGALEKMTVNIVVDFNDLVRNNNMLCVEREVPLGSFRKGDFFSLLICSSSLFFDF